MAAVLSCGQLLGAFGQLAPDALQGLDRGLLVAGRLGRLETIRISAGLALYL